MTITADQIVLDAEVRARSWWHASEWKNAGAVFLFSDNDDLAPLKAYLGKRDRRKSRFRLVLVAVDEDSEAMDANAPPAVEAGAYEREAAHLRASGFLSSAEVLQALGTDEQYTHWVTYQRSIVSGAFNESDQGGDGRNVACHVRRAGEAGTAFKPPYACVPMTNDEHKRQHQGGEFAAWAYFHRLNGRPVPAYSHDAAKAWFDEQLLAMRARWAEQVLCEALRVPALSHVKPLDLMSWAQRNGVVEHLPAAAEESTA